MTSLTLRADNDSVGKLLQDRIKAPLGSKERQEADEASRRQIDQLKSKRTPDDRHRLRMKAFTLFDILSEERWNRPARNIAAHFREFLVDMNDYRAATFAVHGPVTREVDEKKITMTR